MAQNKKPDDPPQNKKPEDPRWRIEVKTKVKKPDWDHFEAEMHATGLCQAALLRLILKQRYQSAPTFPVPSTAPEPQLS